MFRRFIALTITVNLLFFSMAGKRVKTSHKQWKETKTEQLERKSDIVLKEGKTGEDDTHYFSEVICAGFDKEASSSVESFFISNSSDKEVIGIDLEITYYDMKGRQLHRRLEHLTTYIPVGETRKIDIKSWDKQHTFYYHKNNRPSKKICTPFDIKFRIKALFLKN